MQKNKKYKYNAFISYRHADLDMFVAENLHKLIETYKMPDEVIKKYNITDNNVRRVFRDKEELPLSPSLEDPIIKALKDTEFLIVICSPRIKESLWCKKEIETFIKIHGRNNVLCVLIEGEPKDSFPDEVLYYEEKTKSKSGKVITKRVHTEPLAMDVRGNSKREIYKKLKTEVVRVMAPLYNLDYDDIKRRHEERELKRKARIFKITAIVSVIFAIYSFALFYNIYVSSNKLKYDQSLNLAREARESLSNDNRNGAIEKSYQSITKYNNIKMPKTAQGLYELTDSLGVYYNSTQYYPVSQLNTLGVVESMKLNSDSKHLLTYDDSGELVLWNLSNEKRIVTLSDTVSHMTKYNYSFIGKKYLAYFNKNKDVIIVDLNGKVIKKITPNYSKTTISSPFLDSLYDLNDILGDVFEEKDSAYTDSINDLILDYSSFFIKSSTNGKYFEVNDGKKITIYETEGFKEIASYEVSEDTSIVDNQYFDSKEENLIFVTTKKDSNTLNIITYNINSKKIINTTSVNANKVIGIVLNDDKLSLLAIRNVTNNNDYRGNYGTDSIIIRYNYKTGKIDLNKEYKGSKLNDISANFPEDGNNTYLVSSTGAAYLIDYKTGNIKSSYSYGTFDAGVCTLSFDNLGSYLLITSGGDVFNISSKESTYSTNFMLVDYYNFGLNDYNDIIYSSIGFLAINNNDNRIIIYNHLVNNDIKEIDYTKEKKEKEDIDKEEILKKYNFKNKEFISNMFYSTDKELLFIVYKNKEMEIYQDKKQKLLNTVEITNDVPNSYLCKTENDEHIVGEYILNKDLELIAYVPNLVDYKNGKLILEDWNHYYEVPMYSEKQIIKIAKKYLESKGLGI